MDSVILKLTIFFQIVSCYVRHAEIVVESYVWLVAGIWRYDL